MVKKFPKRLFTKVQRIAMEFHEAKRDFDRAIDEIYGCHYSDFDDDWIIDSIDYGGGALTYEDFVERMKKHMNNEEVF